MGESPEQTLMDNHGSVFIIGGLRGVIEPDDSVYSPHAICRIVEALLRESARLNNSFLLSREWKDLCGKTWRAWF